MFKPAESNFALEVEGVGDNGHVDDGHSERNGTLLSASAHIITAVIGSGVLSLAWVTAQLGWLAAPFSLIIFAVITWFTSCLLADCYRFPGPVEGTRNSTYMAVVGAHLGGIRYKLCGMAQYANLIGASIGYTITSAISMAAIQRSDCFHVEGHHAGCHTSNNKFLIIFAATQIILSQIPNFHELSGLSVLAAVMSFAYSSIGVGLSIAKVAGGNHVKTSLTGVKVGADVTGQDKIWNSLQALGNVAFAYTFSSVLIEIQDTLKPHPPENQVMKKASLLGISVTTAFYILCGLMGYAAFGNTAPGNFLTGFGFYEPFWLVDIGNICVVIHLVGAYQVYCQPIFRLVEDWGSRKWPGNELITKEHPVSIPFCGAYRLNFFRLIWRTGYVLMTSLIAITFPVFNSILGLIGALSFWPLSMYFPIEMYLAQSNIRRFTFTWSWLQILSFTCLIISIMALAASVQGLVTALKRFQVFQSVS